MEEINVLWTGGWDSTFRIVELSRQEVVIQPIYVNDKGRKSKEYEYRAMNKITEILLNKKETKSVIKPIKIIEREEIPLNKEITKAYQMIYNKTHLGSQHEWLARLAILYPGLEIGTESGSPETSHIIHAVNEFGKLVIKDGIGYLDKEKSTKEGLLVLGNFKYPIIEKTEKEMLEIIKKWGYEDVMKHIWFCHRPIKDKPCGICHPCCVKIESNMEFLLSNRANKRYKKYMFLKRVLGEKNIDRAVSLYRKIIRA